ncbi:MAG: YigZ family protein [Lachnospiraceae bacterium]|nr:YigZ family protein [Lachnospiraceae bacterium]
MEEQAYKIVYREGIGEFVEKKSRFIAHVFPISEEQEALSHIERLKKEYWDARHNCYAYVIGERNELQRFSDDGEPQGTAGKPILEVLLGEEIHNCLVVVTRYFGGILLGTGGLVRAYQSSTKEGLTQSLITKKYHGKKISIQTDYNGLGKLQYIMGQMDIAMLDTIYTENVETILLVPMWQEDELLKKVTEATAGKAVWNELDEVCFVKVNKEVKLV